MHTIGISAGVRAGAPLASLRDTLAEIAGVGFTHVEIAPKNLNVIVNGRLHEERMARVRRALDGLPLGYTVHGTEVSSAKGGNLFDLTTPAQEQIFAADLAFAAAIGATVLVYHSGSMRDPYADDRAVQRAMMAERDALRRFGDRASDYGITIAVENRDPVARYIIRRAYGFDLLNLAEQIDAIDHQNVRICLDTGHSWLSYSWLGKSEDDYLDDIREIAPLVGHLHITDNFGQVQLDHTTDPAENLASGDGDLHLLPGWGSIPFEKIYAIPFRLDPISNLEIRPHYFEHLEEAFATTTRLMAIQPALL